MPSGPGASKIWAQAIARAKRMGYRHFKHDQEGHRIAARIAEHIAQKQKHKK